jgi:multicomponent Na+:H+ antiporter subunit F
VNPLDIEPAWLQTGLLVALLGLLALMLLGLIRAWAGPLIQDRFTALMLVGSSGVGMLFLLALLLGQPALFDVALVLALLAVVIAVALTRGEPAQNG